MANPRQPGSAAPAFVVHVPAVQVRFTIAGQLWVAQLPGDPSADVWLNGPLVLEYRSIVSPADSAGTSHPFLQVYFDVRAYKDGPVRLDVTVENTLDTAAARTVEYDVEIRAGDQTLFQPQHVSFLFDPLAQTVRGSACSRARIGNSGAMPVRIESALATSPAKMLAITPALKRPLKRPSVAMSLSDFCPAGMGSTHGCC
jgi:hypothetical protein